MTKRDTSVHIHRFQSNVSHLLRRSSTFFFGGVVGLAIVSRSPKGSGVVWLSLSAPNGLASLFVDVLGTDGKSARLERAWLLAEEAGREVTEGGKADCSSP